MFISSACNQHCKASVNRGDDAGNSGWLPLRERHSQRPSWSIQGTFTQNTITCRHKIKAAWSQLRILWTRQHLLPRSWPGKFCNIFLIADCFSLNYWHQHQSVNRILGQDLDQWSMMLMMTTAGNLESMLPRLPRSKTAREASLASTLYTSSVWRGSCVIWFLTQISTDIFHEKSWAKYTTNSPNKDIRNYCGYKAWHIGLWVTFLAYCMLWKLEKAFKRMILPPVLCQDFHRGTLWRTST